VLCGGLWAPIVGRGGVVRGEGIGVKWWLENIPRYVWMAGSIDRQPDEQGEYYWRDRVYEPLGSMVSLLATLAG
jgi:hypothetical protein